jgi:N6-adenosine-specific RNA methylase IME4
MTALLYADPPWRFEVRDRETGLGKAPDRHYPTMTAEELCALPVESWVAADALLVLWVYDPMLPAAFRVAEAWGFPAFVTVLFRWFKTTDGQMRLFDPAPRAGFGQGYHTRGGACEECWLFRRGRGLPVLRHDIRKEFWAPKREHSRKPDEVAGWLVDLYGEVPRCEMFARTRRPGWDAWGNETDKFGEAA